MEKNLILVSSPTLDKLAKRYVWWQSIDWSYSHPFLLLANIMNLGCWDDIQLLRHIVNDEILKQVLLNAPIGYFNYRSWDYWHAKLGITPIPELPKRNL